MTTHRDVGGREYLQLLTTLLQQARLGDPTGGLWEAADLQWWWRRDQHTDARDATFWFDDDGAPVAAVVFTNWGDRSSVDVIELHGDDRVDPTELWRHAGNRMDELPGRPFEVAARDDDSDTATIVGDLGFELIDDRYVACWMPASKRPSPTAMPDEYRLVPRSSRLDRPHHMIGRSGASVAERLLECSLYRPELDLTIETGDGQVAAYGLFWADLVTGVGLVEPMRTEDAHQGRGLAGQLLTAGLDLLAAAGCTRLKISYLDGNEAARRAYLRAGFKPASTDLMLVRSAR
jgi:predicted N-acetyltransferase YhbS